MPTAGASVRRIRLSTGLRLRAFGMILVLPLLVSASSDGGPLHAAVAAADQERWPTTPSEIFVGAGDIADCNWDWQEQTAALLDAIDGTVFTVGDNSQNEGTHQQFRDCYDPSWGRHRWRTRPAIGNHERLSPNTGGYFDYFGEAAGPWGRGYYSYDLGDWHIVVLDSNCEIVSCAPGSPQESWLRDDLAASAAQCTLAIWHHPLFNSGEVGNHPEVRDMWIALAEAGADVVLSAHDHHYERFARQDVDGRRDLRGMRMFIVGTGGATFHRPGTRQPNSEIYQPCVLGVLKMELRPNSYTWEFVSAPSTPFHDHGWDVCH